MQSRMHSDHDGSAFDAVARFDMAQQHCPLPLQNARQHVHTRHHKHATESSLLLNIHSHILLIVIFSFLIPNQALVRQDG